MKSVIQRVKRGFVVNRKTGEEERIGPGLVVLVGFSGGDTDDILEYAAEKISSLRVFPGPGGEFSVSVKESGFEVLLVPQFTLYADIRKGRRPDFSAAAGFQDASRMFESFLKKLSGKVNTKCGFFGADQEVKIVNDGPVTLILEK